TAVASTWDADFLNRHAVSICLIGNPARRPATARQEAELAALVAELQRTLDIPPGAVLLASDLARAAGGPGRLATDGAPPGRD
ncbi:MAG: N-acetylmuramoyl-L-alanine amidase, partial [Planctomycetota bacterium]